MFKEKCLKEKIFREMFKEKRVGNLRKKKVDFSGTASELIEKLKSVSDETFYPNRVTRDLVQNGNPV